MGCLLLEQGVVGTGHTSVETLDSCIVAVVWDVLVITVFSVACMHPTTPSYLDVSVDKVAGVNCC